MSNKLILSLLCIVLVFLIACSSSKSPLEIGTFYANDPRYEEVDGKETFIFYIDEYDKVKKPWYDNLSIPYGTIDVTADLVVNDVNQEITNFITRDAPVYCVNFNGPSKILNPRLIFLDENLTMIRGKDNPSIKFSKTKVLLQTPLNDTTSETCYWKILTKNPDKQYAGQFKIITKYKNK